MGKKTSDYTSNVSVTPDDNSLFDLSERISVGVFESRKWSLTAFKTWVNSWVTASSIAWSNVTGKPTTISGYGITDAVQSNVAIVGATKTKITYDSKGLVTSGSDLIASDIPNLDWSKITSGKPTTLSGYGITDAIDGSGTANKVAKFSDANTLTDSIIQDNGSTACVGGAVSANAKWLVEAGNTPAKGIWVNSSTSSGIASYGYQSGAGDSVGVQGDSYGTGTSAIGVKGQALSTATNNIGIFGYASGGTNNYSAQLKDTTEAVGKILKCVTSDGKANWARFATEIQLACSDETTALTAGTNKITFRMPYAMVVTEVRASLVTAQTSGSIFTVDINESGASILSTKLTIDNTEKTSVTAVTAPVLSDTTLADDAEITVDIDQIGDGTAKGLKILIKGYRETW